MGVPGGDQLLRAHNQHGERTADLIHRADDRFLDGTTVKPLPRDDVRNHLGINRRLKNGTGLLHLLPHFPGIGQIPVMRNGQNPFGITQNQRLGVFTHTAAGRGVAYMRNGHLPIQFLQNLRSKGFGYQPHIL